MIKTKVLHISRGYPEILRDKKPNNLLIFKNLSYSDFKMFWDAKILRTRRSLAVLKLYINPPI